MQARGFKVGCYLRPAQELEEVFAICDFVQISIPAYDGLQIADWVRRLRKRDSKTPVALIAADIESSDDFQVCFRAGFDYFHGSFVNRREDWHPPRANVDRGRIMQVLGQLRSGVEGGELAKTIRQDPVVTYKLLRYINSSANGLEQEITSIEQSLLLLGRERFYRWLSLLLFDVQKAGYIERVLTEQALVRASLLERLGRRTRQDGIVPDQLFLTGLFSLLEKMIEGPLDETLARVSVPPAVSEALLAGSGPLAPFLNLAIACEKGDQEAISSWAAACQTDAPGVNEEMLAALVWANEVLELNG
jgi:c-di-GMP phosphodiesterase